MPSPFTLRIEARPVVIVRVVVGTLCAARALIAWQIARRVFQPGIIRFPVLVWLPTVSLRVVLVAIGIWFVSSILFTAGWYVRASGLVLAIAIGTTLFADQQFYSSHLYLFALEVFLLALANPRLSDKTVEYWPVLLLKLQLSLVYFFAAVSKINPAYLAGNMIGPNLRPGISFGPDMIRAFAILSIVIEMFLAFALWSTRLRKIAVVVGVILHVSMVVMLTPIVTSQLALFAVGCLALYPLYFVKPFVVSRAFHVPSTLDN